MPQIPLLSPEHLRRLDESEDELFYETPRQVAHIDDNAQAALAQFFRQALPVGGEVLDLMSSRFSHLPPDLSLASVVGLGLNGKELLANDQLSGHVIHNLNQTPRMPFVDGRFDACLLTVSVQYLIRPVEVFRDVARVLRPGAPFLISYSNRMFPTKAVAIWQTLGETERAQLVAFYLEETGKFEQSAMVNLVKGEQGVVDPVIMVHTRRKTDKI
jgi:SAM-dependent methyltransferase